VPDPQKCLPTASTSRQLEHKKRDLIPHTRHFFRYRALGNRPVFSVMLSSGLDTAQATITCQVVTLHSHPIGSFHCWPARYTPTHDHWCASIVRFPTRPLPIVPPEENNTCTVIHRDGRSPSGYDLWAFLFDKKSQILSYTSNIVVLEGKKA